MSQRYLPTFLGRAPGGNLTGRGESRGREKEQLSRGLLMTGCDRRCQSSLQRAVSHCIGGDQTVVAQRQREPSAPEPGKRDGRRAGEPKPWEGKRRAWGEEDCPLVTRGHLGMDSPCPPQPPAILAWHPDPVRAPQLPPIPPLYSHFWVPPELCRGPSSVHPGQHVPSGSSKRVSRRMRWKVGSLVPEISLSVMMTWESRVSHSPGPSCRESAGGQQRGLLRAGRSPRPGTILAVPFREPQAIGRPRCRRSLLPHLPWPSILHVQVAKRQRQPAHWESAQAGQQKQSEAGLC